MRLRGDMACCDDDRQHATVHCRARPRGGRAAPGVPPAAGAARGLERRARDDIRRGAGDVRPGDRARTAGAELMKGESITWGAIVEPIEGEGVSRCISYVHMDFQQVVNILMSRAQAALPRGTKYEIRRAPPRNYGRTFDMGWCDEVTDEPVGWIEHGGYHLVGRF